MGVGHHVNVLGDQCLGNSLDPLLVNKRPLGPEQCYKILASCGPTALGQSRSSQPGNHAYECRFRPDNCRPWASCKSAVFHLRYGYRVLRTTPTMPRTQGAVLCVSDSTPGPTWQGTCITCNMDGCSTCIPSGPTQQAAARASDSARSLQSRARREAPWGSHVLVLVRVTLIVRQIVQSDGGEAVDDESISVTRLWKSTGVKPWTWTQTGARTRNSAPNGPHLEAKGVKNVDGK